MIEAAAPALTMHRPTAREVRIMHEAVKKLVEKLHKERFDIDLVWDHGDDHELDRYLQVSVNIFSPWPTIAAKIETHIRAYFASDGISGGDRPYQWLATLGKYCGGPLNKNGELKSMVAAREAEVRATIAASIHEAEKRKAAATAADTERLLARLMLKVAEDLHSRGFELYRPWGAVSHVVAMRKSVGTRNAPAMRIVVRANSDEVTRNAPFYQAVISPDQDVRISPITYYPSLELE